MDDSYNIFANLHKNLLFVIIIFTEIFIQFCIVEYGGLVFNCVKGGLTFEQWIICITIASSSLVISFLLKCTSLEKVFEINYFNKLKSLFNREDDYVEREQLVEMVENSDDYIEEKSFNRI